MKLETGLDWLAGWFFHLSVGMIGILPVFSLPRKGKNKKTLIQLEEGSKIRSQSCKIGRQTYTCKIKVHFLLARNKESNQ
jgi:hypothetical protein